MNMGPLTTVQDYGNTDEIETYPNPVSDKLIVSSTIEKGKYSIEFIDVLGKSVYIEELHIEPMVKNELDVSFLEKGVYLLNIYNHKKGISKKFIKE